MKFYEISLFKYYLFFSFLFQASVFYFHMSTQNFTKLDKKFSNAILKSNPFLHDEKPSKTPDSTLANIVIRINFGINIDLERIVRYVPEAEHDPTRFAALVLRCGPPKSCALIFSKGLCVMNGLKTKHQMELGCEKYARILRETGHNVTSYSFEIKNSVLKGSVGGPVDTKRLYKDYPGQSTACDKFPGLRFNLPQYKVTVSIFTTGRFIIVGIKTKRQAEKAYDDIMKILPNYLVSEIHKLPKNKKQKELEFEFDLSKDIEESEDITSDIIQEDIVPTPISTPTVDIKKKKRKKKLIKTPETPKTLTNVSIVKNMKKPKIPDKNIIDKQKDVFSVFKTHNNNSIELGKEYFLEKHKILTEQNDTETNQKMNKNLSSILELNEEKVFKDDFLFSKTPTEDNNLLKKRLGQSKNLKDALSNVYLLSRKSKKRKNLQVETTDKTVREQKKHKITIL